MLAAHRPRALAQMGDDHIGDAQIVEADRGGNDVHDGIHRAHFMEMHLFQRQAVRLRFRFRHDAENALCNGPGMVGHIRAVNDGLHIGQMAVPMMMPLFMMVVMTAAPLFAVMVSASAGFPSSWW